MIELNKVYNTDCFALLKDIPDNFIDQIITDPPYFINYNNEEWDREKDLLFFQNLAYHFYRTTKDNSNIILFSGWSNASKIINIFCSSKFILNDWIIWDRIKGRGAKKRLTSTREDILWFIKNENYVFNKTYSNIKKKTGGMGNKNGQPNRSLSNVWTDISPIVPWSKERVNHPTQKPLQLIERLITIFSNKNDIILDPFMGSGTTAIACLKFYRNFIGSESKKEYIDIILQRLKNN